MKFKLRQHTGRVGQNRVQKVRDQVRGNSFKNYFAVVLLISISPAAWAQSTIFPDDDFEPVVREKCTSCHTAPHVVAQRRTANQWAQIVEEMIFQGAQVSDEEFNQIVTYLAKHFGPVELEVQQSEVRKKGVTSENQSR